MTRQAGIELAQEIETKADAFYLIGQDKMYTFLHSQTLSLRKTARDMEEHLYTIKNKLASVNDEQTKLILQAAITLTERVNTDGT